MRNNSPRLSSSQEWQDPSFTSHVLTNYHLAKGDSVHWICPSGLGKESLAFKASLLRFNCLNGWSNLRSPQQCLLSPFPIGIIDLTSEMKASDLTGFLKGSSCRNYNRFPSSQLAIMCQEIFHRTPVNFHSVSLKKSPKES